MHVLQTTGAVVYLARLRFWREQAALTQAELAAKAGITQTHLSRIERGEIQPRPATIRRLAEALGVRPADLMPPPERTQP